MFRPKNENLNWTVSKQGLTADNGIRVESHVALVRDDIGATLSVMKKDYTPYQNAELMDLLEKVGDRTGMEIKNQGYFGTGEKVFLQLKSDDLSLNGDRIEGYLTGINSFDGSTPLAFGPSTITISCMNTFFASFRQLESKVRHTKNMHLKIEDILRGLERTREEEKLIFEKITRLADVRSLKENEEKVIRTLFNIDKKVDLTNEKELSTVTLNRINAFKVDLMGEMKEKGDNLWGLFSGVTKYTTHTMNRGNYDKNVEDKMLSFYGQRERQIFNDLAMNLVH